MKRSVLIYTCLMFIAVNSAAQQTRFLNTILHYRSTVIDFREEGLPGNIKDGVLVYPSPADLKVGDVFIDLDGKAKKVAVVTKVGKDLYIDTVQPQIEEVLLFGHIPEQTITFNEDNFIAEPARGANYAIAKKPASKGYFKIEFEKELYKNEAETFLAKFTGGTEGTSGITVGWALPYYWLKAVSWWDWQWQNEKGYILAKVGVKQQISGTLAVSVGKTKKFAKIPLYAFGTPSIPGITADMGLFTQGTLEGKIELTVPLTLSFEAETGVQATLEGMLPVIWVSDTSKIPFEPKFSIVLNPALTAEASYKQKIFLGTEVTVLGIKISKFEAGGGPYIKINGSVSCEVGYDSATGPILPDKPILEASGEFGLFIEAGGEICDGKWSVSFFNNEYPIFKIAASNATARSMSQTRVLAYPCAVLLPGSR